MPSGFANEKEYCNTPKTNGKGQDVFHAYSLVPPLPAVFFMHNGEVMGGYINMPWNAHSKCASAPVAAPTSEAQGTHV
jgi:hypothetical protein